jgi:putative DNA primase/helicase
VLTTTEWEDRPLGVTDMIRVPNRAVWVATANNVTLSNELTRRSVSIRIDANVERPFERTGFRHPALLDYAEDKRPQLVHAALTIVRAWICAGRPLGGQTIGSYERWAQVVGGILSTIGVQGFLANRDRLLETADDDTATWHQFIEAWAEKYSEQDVTAAELRPIAETIIELGQGDERSRTKRLGKALRSHRDCVFGEWRIEQRGVIRGSRQWGLRRPQR